MTLPAPQLAAPTATTAAVLMFEEGFATWSDDATARREHLGGKGAGLAEMAAAGVPVPPGFTIVSDVCRRFYQQGERLDDAIFTQVVDAVARIEHRLNRRFGDRHHPLFLSVRSGSKFSMPGMMDTVLNLGMNERTVIGLAEETRNPRFAWDCFRRFLQMYGHVVGGIEKGKLDEVVSRNRDRYACAHDIELSPGALQTIVDEMKSTIVSHTGAAVPSDPHAQLRAAIEAVFRSWNTERAIYYRTLHGIDHHLGTAATIQAMVFGNRNERSATGVCFTRNPSTGERGLYGEFLPNAQGEDVVAGIRTPQPIAALTDLLPDIAPELERTAHDLERHYREVQDIEFTIEDGRLFILQTRTGKRSATAAVRIALDMVDESIIDKATALRRVTPEQVQQLLVPGFDDAARAHAVAAGDLIATGLNASPGAAYGQIVFSPADAVAARGAGRAVILVREETCPDDIHGIVAARGIVTARGGMTSHAAVVARGIGKPCVAGCEALTIDMATQTLRIGPNTLHAGDSISIDGSSGEVFRGAIKTFERESTAELKRLLSWADEYRRLGVYANADTPSDAARARANGAEGIGLCRTEHMFMGTDRLPRMHAMILATTRAERERALSELLPLQRSDFTELFREMRGLPVTIRLLDPPLHEFLPRADAIAVELEELRRIGEATDRIAGLERTLQRIHELAESNPMMGFRGCRLGLVHPEIYSMQIRAIMEAALTAHAEGVAVKPEILIPLVSTRRELALVRAMIEQVALKVLGSQAGVIRYSIGTMIEVPRACVVADELAHEVDFFSFGTNDLTQMTFGFSRDDAEATFLRHYLEGVNCNGQATKVLERNPFETIDEHGVGTLMRIALERGRRTRPLLKFGLCGEHGGEARSISFCDRLGLSYVSCSPYRIPAARLAAARSALGETLTDL